MIMLRNVCAVTGLTVGLASFLMGDDVTLNLQKSTDGLSGWTNVPLTSVDLTPEGAIDAGTIASGESVFYRVEIVVTEPPPPPPYVPLVINEVDYDQDLTDNDEFVEILNVGTEALDLTGISLVLVNGNGNVDYTIIDLGTVGSLAAGGYLVVASGTVSVDPGATTILFDLASNNIQNGPDAVALFNMTEGYLIDALSYEGAVNGATITGLDGTFDLVEGTLAVVNDFGTIPEISLIRNPNGQDTNDASVDWVQTTTITPGAANVVTAPAVP